MDQRSLPVTVAQRIDRACDRFEAGWGSDRPETVESLLQEAPPSEERDWLVALAALEIELRRERGDVLELAEFAARFPRHVDLLRSLFAVDDTAATLPDVRSTVGRERLPPSGAPSLDGYEILEPLGRGGMGVVYLARQTRLGRLVAVKLMRGEGQACREDAERFQRETLALAALHHPRIAAIHDAGWHELGPFMVMEYLEGGALSKRVRERLFEPREAARMVREIALGVEFAHRSGVIHRDLNPSNVLLTRDGEPKVADFGLARWFDAEPRGSIGRVAGTPSYMAPEQTLELATVGPPADIYGLGAILYELLTGKPPFQAANLLAVLEQVRECEPIPPSRFQSRLPADLENICLRCLEKDPRRRYANAADLAADLDRFLAGRPVVARPVSAVTHAWRWTQRNPLLATLAATLAAAVFLGLAGTRWQLAQARVHLAEANRQRGLYEESYVRARELADELTQVSSRDLAQSPRLAELRRRILERAEAFYRRAAEERRGDAPLRRDFGLTLLRLADLQRQLGQPDAAIGTYEEANRTQRDLLAIAPDDLAAQRHLAGGLQNLAGILRGRGPESLQAALALQRESVDAWRQIVPRPDALPESHLELAKALHSLGTLLAQQGDAEGAAQAWIETGEVLDQAPQDVRSSPAAQLVRARTLSQWGNQLEERREFDESRRRHAEAVKICRVCRAETPESSSVTEELADCLNNLAIVEKRLGNQVEAAAAYLEAVELTRELRADSPHHPDYAGSLSRTLFNLGMLAGEQQEFERAAEYFSESLLMQLELAQRSPNDLRLRRQVASRIARLYQCQIALGQLTAAAETARRRSAIWPNDFEQQYQLARELAAVARLAADADRDAVGQATPTPPDRSTLIQESLGALRRALVGGWRPDPPIEVEQEFEALRGLPEFQELVTMSRGRE